MIKNADGSIILSKEEVSSLLVHYNIVAEWTRDALVSMDNNDCSDFASMLDSMKEIRSLFGWNKTK